MRYPTLVFLGASLLALACNNPSGGQNSNNENKAVAEKPGTTGAAKEAPGAKDAPVAKDAPAPKDAPAAKGDAPSGGGAGQEASAGLTIVEGFAGIDPVTNEFLHIAGEVKNETGGWVTHVKLYLQIMDTDGKPILVTGISEGVKQDMGLGADAPETILGDRMYVPPGESTPYFYIRDVAKLSGKKYGSHKLKVVGRKVDKAPKVTVTDLKYTEAKDFFESLSGNVVVESGECRSPEPVFVHLMADGKVRATTSHAVDAYFQKVAPAGTKVPFDRKALSRYGAAKVIAYGTCTPED